jgi:uncharacterized protein
MDTAALKVEIEAFLAAHHVMTLATVDDDGVPHAASVMYAVDGLAMYWMSKPDTRHSQHIERRSRVTVTVAPDYADFRMIRGLQIEGAAKRLADETELARAREQMISRYVFLRELATGPAALRAAIERAGFYCLAPARITLIDNTKGFGHKASLEVSDTGSISNIEQASGGSSPVPETGAASNHAPKSNYAAAVAAADQEILGIIGKSLLEDFRRLPRKMSEGLSRNDHELVELSVHTMKGFLGYFGETRALELAEQAHALAMAGRFAEIPSLLPDIETQMAAVRDALARHLAPDRYSPRA